MAIASLVNQQQRAAVHRLEIPRLREEVRDEREGDSFGRRQAIQITTYPDSRRPAGCAVRQPPKSRSRYSARPSILLRSLAAMTIDLAAREPSDILEGLDNAIECMVDWSDDELNTARDRGDIRRKTRKIWRLVKKLIVYAPNHYMAVSVKGASRGSGATATLNGTELGNNGGKPVATKLCYRRCLVSPDCVAGIRQHRQTQSGACQNADLCFGLPGSYRAP
jgi:hypothetical protein